LSKDKNKIELLQTDYAKEKFAQFEKERRQVIFRRRRLAVFFIAALALFAIVGIQLFNDQVRLQKLNEYKAETIAKQEAAEKENADLARDVALLQDDEYVAKLARSRLFYSKDDEKIYPVLPDSNETDTTGDATEDSTESTTASQD
jgi:cell division protein DivIC